jgi:hypothetical protein
MEGPIIHRKPLSLNLILQRWSYPLLGFKPAVVSSSASIHDDIIIQNSCEPDPAVYAASGKYQISVPDFLYMDGGDPNDNLGYAFVVRISAMLPFYH